MPSLLPAALRPAAFDRLLFPVAVSAAITAGVFVASPAGAAVPGGCSASGATVTCPFAFTGDEQQFTVPGGVRRLHVELVGGRGFGPNAFGGQVAADLAVTPGQVLYVEVGGPGGAPAASPSLGGAGGTGGSAGGGAAGGSGGAAGGIGGTGGTGGAAGGSGGDGGPAGGIGGTGGAGGVGGGAGGGGSTGGAGGFNGGGAGSLGEMLGGGGGGGASDIRTCSSSASGCDSLGSRLVVAGGGGGIGGNSVGGSGGDPNGHDALHYDPNDSPGGYGATQAGPGLSTPPPTPFLLPDEWGDLGRGGEGLDATYTAPDGRIRHADFGGGGGGGGLYGGSGGFPGSSDVTHSHATGGGGGSSWGPAGSVYAAGTSKDPAAVTISYTADVAAPAIQVAAPAEGATYALDQAVTAGYACSDGPDGSGVVSCQGTVVGGAPIDTATAGQHTFTVDAVDAAGNRASQTIHYTVRGPDAPTSMSTPPSTPAPTGAAPSPAGGAPTGSGGQPGATSPVAIGSQTHGGAASTGGTPGDGNPPSADGAPDRTGAGTHPTSAPGVFGLGLTARHVRLHLTSAAVVVVTIDRRSGQRWQRVRRVATDVTHAGTLTLPIAHLPAGRYRVTVHLHAGLGSRTSRVIATLPHPRREG
jgi:hypothetical protein